MNPTLMLYPVFAQVALTFFLLIRTGRARVTAVAGGEVKVADIALGQPAWPDRVTQLGRCYQNQFELPVLFYVFVVIYLQFIRQAHVEFLALAWAFVALRYAHAYVHTTSNHLRTRFNLFASGFFVLMVMWVLFAARLVLTPPPT